MMFCYTIAVLMCSAPRRYARAAGGAQLRLTGADPAPTETPTNYALAGPSYNMYGVCATLSDSFKAVCAIVRLSYAYPARHAPIAPGGGSPGLSYH